MFKSPQIKLMNPDKQLWQLTSSLNYNDITVPIGFITDLSSVPRIFWSIYPPSGRYMAASIVHDFLYCRHSVSRKKADIIFLEAMKESDPPVRFATRYLFYWAVRLFGQKGWDKDYNRC